MNNQKYLEYYLDASLYSGEEVQKSIDETKKEFSNREAKVTVSLNSFGMYVVTFCFQDRNTIFHKIRVQFRKKTKEPKMLQEKNQILARVKDNINQEKNKNRFEKYYGENRYGQYKTTKTYRPY